ncbi:MAG: DUF1428 family protein [Alphaproteobacteria bacterium]|nr:DUF1428 family protein [Alphaproteobacteria bacterium]
MSYVDGFVIPLGENGVEDYRKIAETARTVWLDHGAVDYKECVLEDMKESEFGMGFKQLAGAKDGETVVLAYIVFKDRYHRDEVNAKVMADKRLTEACDPNNMPFDCKRMAYGGFKTIVGE